MMKQAPAGHALCGCFLKYASLTDIVRTRFAGHLFTPDFISFFAGRQPGGITQFRLTQKSAPAKSEISESV